MTITDHILFIRWLALFYVFGNYTDNYSYARFNEASRQAH